MASELVLFDHAVSSFAQKVRIALREKGIPFQVRNPFADAAAAGSGFTVANLREEVPFLVDGQVRIFDSTIILEYLEDKWPDQSPLRPNDPAARARARMIEDVCDTHYEAINWGLGEVCWFGRADEALSERLKSVAAEQTAKIQNWLNEQLGDGEYFGGDQFAVSDISVFPVVNRSVHWGFGPPFASPLAMWLDRVKQRPSVRETVAEYEAALPSMPAAAPIYLSGKRRREYRDHRLEWMIKSGGIDIVLAGLRDKNIRFSWP